MSNLKFARAMFTSKGMETARYGPESPPGEAQIAARMAEAREVNDGLRALFLPQHGRRPWVSLAVVTHLPADGRRAGNCICRTAPPPSRQCALEAADDRRSESTGWPPARLCDRTSSRLRPSRRSRRISGS